jgi:2-dehydro-3-deoxyphosphogalactonate aldolase
VCLEVAIARGIELAEMGCGALEITMDSTDCLKILKALVAAVGDKVLVGVGTVEDKMQIEAVADAGARFALAPVNPYGMVQAAHARGVLAMPAAMTPQVTEDSFHCPSQKKLR